MTVRFRTDEHVAVVSIDRPAARNAVDGPTAEALAAELRRFEDDHDLYVCVLTGEGEHFCAGADLKAIAVGRGNRLEDDGDGPMGPTRMLTHKPVIAAIEGYAVAGGLELACWCDLRVMAEDATVGVFCRRFGVPLIDGGTVRLPRLIGLSRALDLLLTGRAVSAREAEAMGLANRVVPKGEALAAAVELAKLIGAHPQACMRNDRRSAYEQAGMSLDDALKNEFALGRQSLASPDFSQGFAAFGAGEGRGGKARSR